MKTMRELIKDELKKNITQRDLAGRLHFSHSTIQKILFTETKHTYEIRKKVADYFGVPVSDFYDEEDSGQSGLKAANPNADNWKDEYIAELRKENAELRKQLDRLTAPSGGAADDAG